MTSGGTIPDRGLFGVFVAGESQNARVGELDEEMVYESRVNDVFTLGTTSWRIVEITHDRVNVLPAFGQPGKLPFWHGDGLGRPAELGEALGRFSREVSAADPREGPRSPARRGSRRQRVDQPPGLPRRAARGHRDAADRQGAHRRTRPRRGRRLARHPAFPLRHEGARAVGAGRQRPHPRAPRRRRIGGRERRRHHRAGSGCRGRASGRRAVRLRTRRARADRHRRGRRIGAVRLALPRVRRACAADAPHEPEPPLPAVAAAAAIGAAARGRPPVPDVPDHPRDPPRSAAGRLRRPRAAAHRPQHRRSPHPPRRDHDHPALAVRARPAVRLRRRVHVRGRLPARRAPRRRALGRPGSAERAARQGRDARAPRPRDHRAVRARGAAPRPRPPRARHRGRRRPAPDAGPARRR